MNKALPILTLIIVGAQAFSQGSNGTVEFSADEWPGSERQANRLAAQPRDEAWAAPMEGALTYQLDRLDRLEVSDIAIECRTNICGAVFGFSVPIIGELPVSTMSASQEDMALSMQPASRLTWYIMNVMHETFGRDDMRVSHRLRTQEIDGVIAGTFELTARDLCRSESSSDSCRSVL